MATPTAALQARADELAKPLAAQVLPQLQQKYNRFQDVVSEELTMGPAVTRELFASGVNDPDQFGRMVLDAVCRLIQKQLTSSLVTAGRAEHRPNVDYRPGDTAYFTVSASRR